MYPFSSSSSSYSSSSSNSNTPPPPPPMYYQDSNIGYGSPFDAQQGMDQQMAQQINYHQFQQVANQQGFGQPAYEQHPQFGAVQEQYYAAPPPQHFQGFPVMALPYQPMDQFAPQAQNHFGVYPAQMENLENVLPENSQLAPKKKQKRQRNKEKSSKMHANTKCVICGSTETSMWRRNDDGVAECNACSQYETKTGKKRPECLWDKPRGQRRRRPVCERVGEEPSTSSLKSSIKKEPYF